MLEAIFFALGTLVGLGGLGIGFGAGRRSALRASSTPPEPICGCDHNLAMHDPNTGQCHATVKQRKYNKHGEGVGYDHVPCTCRQYVGPRPIDSVFAPPMLPPGN